MRYLVAPALVASTSRRSRVGPERPTLAAAYDLIVFPGHHEYVTGREYALVEAYRNLRGNLSFLSANNLFWRVVKHGNLMENTEQWRDLTAPRPR